MTAPRVLAPLDVDMRTMRHEARERHDTYKQHVLLDSHNTCCRGRLCPKGQRLLELADDAGKRLQRAEERERARP